MTRTLGRILLLLLLPVVAVLGLAPGAAAADCGDGQLSLSCTELPLPTGPGPQPAPEPEPEPAPAPEPAPEPAPAPQDPPARPADGIATTAQAVSRLLALIEADRRAGGLVDLATQAPLAEVAAAHSSSMAARGQLWHNDDLFTAATKSRLGIRLVGENVASNVSIDDAHRRLMASPAHRANLMSRSFRQIGVGVARAGDTWYVTEVFATPVASRPVPVVAAAATPAPPRAPTAARPARSAVPARAGSGPAAADATPVVEVSLEVPATAPAPEPVALGTTPARRDPASSLTPSLLAGAFLLAVGLLAWRCVPRPLPRLRVLQELLVKFVWCRLHPWVRLQLPAGVAFPHRRLGGR